MTAPLRHPFDVIARVLAARLQAREPPDELWATVRSPAVDWERVVGHASAQLVLPAFAAALRDLGLLGSLDGELAAFLDAVHAANVERNAELRDELAAAARLLNRAEIKPVLLKGAIRLVDGLYPDQGWRMLRDLDVLVPNARWSDAIGVLREAGYALTHAVDKSAALRHRDGLVEIELHRELFSARRARGLLRGKEVLDGSRPAAFEDLAVRLPPIEHQIAHLVGHSQIKHRGYATGRISFRDRLEAAALVRWSGESIDWNAVFARFSAAGYRRPLLTLLVSLDLSDVPVPRRIDPLTALQRRRIALQARSTTLGQLGALAGWCASELKSQVRDRDGDGLKALNNLRRLISERGAGSRMARALVYRAPRPW